MTSQSGPAQSGPAQSGPAQSGPAQSGPAQSGPAVPTELTGPPGTAGPVSPEARRWLDGAAVERPVLELRPDYTALIIVAEGLRPGPSDEASDALLRDAEAQAKAALAGRDPGELAPVAAWRAAYQAFGAKPKRTRPSVEALLRRVRGRAAQDRPAHRHLQYCLVVREMLPCGGEDLAAYPTVRHPPDPRGRRRAVRAAWRVAQAVKGRRKPGEVIYRDAVGVICRCWNWRQCVRTRITHDDHQRHVHPRRPGRARPGRPGERRAGTGRPAGGAPCPAGWRHIDGVGR